jgi:hypothetical protein
MCSSVQYYGADDDADEAPPHAASSGDYRAKFNAQGAAAIGKRTFRTETKARAEIDPKYVSFLLWDQNAFFGLPDWAADAVRAVIALAATAHARPGATLRL